ncbi:hypothetical protein BBP40_001389 [Aspergillus hancockii]|nr:hypothetical protein BBP40_001389 [Aspergillus hancockii]
MPTQRCRHIKCDEGKPICGLCLKNDKSCRYAQPSHSSASAGPSVVTDDGSQPSRTEEPQQVDAPLDDALENSGLSAQCEVRTVSWTGLDTESLSHPPPSLDQLQELVPANYSPIAPQCHDLSSPHAPYATKSVTSGSTNSPGATVNAATVRWFGLLANDVARESPQLSTTVDGYGNETIAFEQTENGELVRPSSLQRATQVLDHQHSVRATSTPTPDTGSRDTNEHIRAPLEEKLWQAQEPINLLPREHVLFENFVQRVSQWIDLFDPTSQFSTLVPHLALRNAGLMNAILALSCRHLSLNPRLDKDEVRSEPAALQYYYQTLHYVQKAMLYSSYKTSPELLATALIISAYEMLDNSTNDWERHLEGVFLIQRSQVIHGESGGLHAAVWWAWLCQDVWAAFRENRKTFTFWTPQKPLASLSPHELAARSVFITAKVVSFCSQEKLTTDENIQSRIVMANQLRTMLDDWRSHLTIEFSPLPVMSADPSFFFRPIWIRPPGFGVAIQLYCAARILLLSHEPNLGGLSIYLERQNVIDQCIENICGIAMMLSDDASSMMSSQAIFIAGMFTKETRSREAVLGLLDSCRQRTGWPVKPLRDELRQFWDSQEPAKASGPMGTLLHLYP